MDRNKQSVLDKTHYGLTIYTHVLQEYYPGETVLSLSGRGCRPAKNPFNHNRPSLDIYWCNNLFRFKDDELSDFAGDPFDFAELHYELHKKALLQKLDEVMNLGIGDFQSPVEKLWLPLSIPVFSLFLHPVSNVNPYQTINLREAWNLIRSPYYKDLTRQLRALDNPNAARRFKATQLDYATFSGVFTKRSDGALQQHSGLLTIDFDHVPQLSELKLLLSVDPCFETELMFVSPSGDGLKWIVPIDLREASHQEWFRAIDAYLFATYRLEIDKSGKDISRACFLPCDPEAYLNPKYQKQEVLPQKMDSHEAR